VARPWADLGGLVSERLRWLHRFTLLSSLWIGGCAARYVWLEPPRTTSDVTRGLRWLLYPPAVAAAAATLTSRLTGEPDRIGVVLTGLVGFASAAWVGSFDPLRRAVASGRGGLLVDCEKDLARRPGDGGPADLGSIDPAQVVAACDPAARDPAVEHFEPQPTVENPVTQPDRR
jgi:hypothetical protein